VSAWSCLTNSTGLTKLVSVSSEQRNRVVGAICTDVWKAASSLGVVETGAGVRRWVIRKPALDSRGLVGRQREDVGEATAGVNHSLAGFLRLYTCGKSLNNIRARNYLRCAG